MGPWGFWPTSIVSGFTFKQKCIVLGPKDIDGMFVIYCDLEYLILKGMFGMTLHDQFNMFNIEIRT